MSDDKVLEALQIIKKHCEEQGINCENCKLSKRGECAIDFPPSDWKINVNKEYKFIL